MIPCLINILSMGALKDFLGAERELTDSMSQAELEIECNGWRAMINMFPQEMLEWVVRLGEPFRVVTRKYEPKTGILVNVKMEVKEYALEILEPSFDSIRGCRLIEQKILTIGEEVVAYYEDVTESTDLEDWESQQQLATQSLDI